MKRCPACDASCMDSHRHCPSCGADVAHATMSDGDPYVGSTLAGKYRLVEMIGTGAMGRVYRAQHLALESEVAVKLLNPDLAGDPQTVRRFQTEARAASRLRHPNTIQILDFGQAETGVLFLVMEYLRGRTLAKIIEEERLTPRRIRDLLGQALAALDEAHAMGVVHRDFKPENIFIEMLRTGREHVKVLDFGIAKLRGEADPNLTSRGAVCGTPEYMSPEQIRGEELDARSDVYAAGVVLYEMLTATRPFETHGAVIEILQAHLNQKPVPPRQRRPDWDVPSVLEDVCMKALAKAVTDRFRSASELRHALEAAERLSSGERCKLCGAQVLRTSRFCPDCGTALHDEESHSTPRRAASDSPAPVPVPLPLPLVGRRQILDRLAALDGEGVLVVGGPGIGKSALMGALTAAERARGRTVLHGGRDASGASRPLHPVREAVAQRLGVGMRPTLDELRAAVVDQRGRSPDLVGLSELFGCRVSTEVPRMVRERELTAAALSVLRRDGALLIFEDAHLYDLPSRQLLAQLLSHPGPTTVIVTAQHVEAVDAEVEVMRLPPLDAAAIGELVHFGLPAGVGEMVGGVPLAIERWLRARVEGCKEATLPARLAQLPPAARVTLEGLALTGEAIGAAGLSLVQADDPGAVDELLGRGFLAPAPARVALRSPTQQSGVLEAMPEERRRKLHALWARHLATSGADPVLVGHHAYHGGETSSGSAIERAADACRDAFDDDGAVRWYRAALERGRQALSQGGGDESHQIRLALKLGIVLRYRRELEASEAVLRDALDLAMVHKDAWAIVEARRALARLAVARGEPERGRQHLVAAMQSSLGRGDVDTLAELYLELADVLQALGDDDGAERELWEGVTLCTGGDGPDAKSGPTSLWRMLLLLGQRERSARHLRQAVALGRHALRHAARVGTSDGRARVLAFLAQCEADGDRPMEAIAQRRAAVEILRSLGDRRGTAELLLALAETPVPGDDSGASIHFGREAEALCNELGWREGAARSRAALAALGLR